MNINIELTPQQVETIIKQVLSEIQGVLLCGNSQAESQSETHVVSTPKPEVLEIALKPLKLPKLPKDQKIVKALNTKTGKIGNYKPHNTLISEVQIQEIAKKYKAGMSIPQLGRIYGFKYDTIYSRLGRLGLIKTKYIKNNFNNTNDIGDIENNVISDEYLEDVINNNYNEKRVNTCNKTKVSNKAELKKLANKILDDPNSPIKRVSDLHPIVTPEEMPVEKQKEILSFWLENCQKTKDKLTLAQMAENFNLESEMLVRIIRNNK
jgi:hypothetical protein